MRHTGPSERPIPSWARYLAAAGQCAPSADNSQPWELVLEDDGLGVDFDECRGGGLGRDHPAVLMGLGAVIENLVQAAASAGMPTGHWEFRRPGSGETRFLWIPAPARDIDPRPIPHELLDRHTNRNPFSKAALPPDLIAAKRGEMESGVGVQWFADRASIRRLGELVRLASQLRFQTEDVHRWLARSLRFSAAEVARGDGLDVGTLNLPPGAALLLRFISDWRRMEWLNRLGAYRLLARVEAAQLSSAGAVAAIVGQDQGAQTWVSAGRLMERLWVSLNSRGLAAQPFFVLADQLHRLRTDRVPDRLQPQTKRLAQLTQDCLGPSDRTLFLLLRVGEPSRPAARSRRLPLESILVRNAAAAVRHRTR